MGNPFVQEENYTETIVDPRDGDEWTVTLRTLNAGDEAAIRDETVIEIEEDEEHGEIQRQRVPMGRLQLVAVEAALVSWTLPMTLSPAAIKALNGDIFKQIYGHVRVAEAKKSTVEEDPPTGAHTGSPKAEPSAGDESSKSKPSS